MIRLYLFAAFLLVQDQPRPLPDLKPFIAELRKTLHTDSHLLSQYTYTEKQTMMQLERLRREEQIIDDALGAFEVKMTGAKTLMAGHTAELPTASGI